MKQKSHVALEPVAQQNGSFQADESHGQSLTVRPTEKPEEEDDSWDDDDRCPGPEDDPSSESFDLFGVVHSGRVDETLL
jgi:hypothetical protein